MNAIPSIAVWRTARAPSAKMGVKAYKEEQEGNSGGKIKRKRGGGPLRRESERAKAQNKTCHIIA